MKRLVPIPTDFAARLKEASETGLGYQVVSVELKNGNSFDQVATSEGYVIEVRGYDEIPFSADEIGRAHA